MRTFGAGYPIVCPVLPGQIVAVAHGSLARIRRAWKRFLHWGSSIARLSACGTTSRKSPCSRSDSFWLCLPCWAQHRTAHRLRAMTPDRPGPNLLPLHDPNPPLPHPLRSAPAQSHPESPRHRPCCPIPPPARHRAISAGRSTCCHLVGSLGQG